MNILKITAAIDQKGALWVTQVVLPFVLEFFPCLVDTIFSVVSMEQQASLSYYIHAPISPIYTQDREQRRGLSFR